MKTFIPFQGFYISIYDDQLDYVHEQDVENLEEQYPNVAPSNISDEIYNRTDWKKAHEIVAKAYVQYFNDYVKGETGVDLGLTFVELVSPKFYNFGTDRILCEIPLESVKALRMSTPNSTFAHMIWESHTSRDGFHSFYSNNIHHWLAKNLEDYDANEVQTLLMSWMEHHLEEEWEHVVFEQMCDDGVFYDALGQAQDWPAIEEAIENLEKVHD